MPRKQWKPKNRYFKRSRLSEETFVGLIRCYLEMKPAKASADFIADKYATKISRQSVTNYFLNFGAYLFNEFYILHVGILNVSMNLRKPEVKVAKGFLEISNNKASIAYPTFKFLQRYQNGDIEMGSPESIVAHCIAYAMQYQSYINEEDISEGDGVVVLPDNRFIISLLRHDVAVSKGMDNESFPYHFARAYFIDATIGASFSELQKQYSGQDVELFLRDDVQDVLLSKFLNILKKRPIQKY